MVSSGNFGFVYYYRPLLFVSFLFSKTDAELEDFIIKIKQAGITDFLEKRRNIMDQEMANAKADAEEANELKKKRETEYNDLKNKSKGYLDSAKEKGEVEKARIISEAKHNADQMLERTKKEIEAEKIKAKASLQKEVVDLAALMAEKILKQEVDEQKYQDLLVEDMERSEKS